MCDHPGYKTKYAHCGPQVHYGDMRGLIRGMMHQMKGCFEKFEHWIPHAIEEYEDYFLIQVPLPGYSKEDIEISLISDNINVKAKKSEVYKQKDKPVNKEESKRSPEFFVMGNFMKIWNKDLDFDIPLPSNSDQEDIKPKIANGLLKIKVGKKPPKNINIDEEI